MSTVHAGGEAVFVVAAQNPLRKLAVKVKPTANASRSVRCPDFAKPVKALQDTRSAGDLAARREVRHKEGVDARLLNGVSWDSSGWYVGERFSVLCSPCSWPLRC
ncbi:hypothetical protein GCM10022214_48670 [Actinomadura miaoliensis]|uniref:DUF397 domain-containing protein n=1 Tax=Actinomadura miaoliensis TaxID=430685 RepID=A0ABP7W8D4_9ACTN